ncbi:MAG: hypothetical protein FWC26_13010 [Fibromonadales bacterium]|nr:hypothetical protein [Fibromonadales bacterium]
MKHLLLIISLLLLCSCDVHDDGSSYKNFSYEMRGVWERINSEPWDEPAQIEIGYDNITITGTIYHFGNLPKGVKLEAYADSGFIRIKARDEWQSPVYYKLWPEYGSYTKNILTLIDSNYTDIDFKLTEVEYEDNADYTDF